ncbi:MAG: WXG100 family type VII secretion target, partial [Bianqueaceae bacterium]
MRIFTKYVPKHARKKLGNAMKRILPVILSLALLTGVVTPVLAAGTPSEKEEVIYINLSAGGSVKDIYAVNIFGTGDITDYGDYSSGEILNTEDKISQSGDMITFSTSADRVYYKGKMTTTVMPWNISIQYFIDGTEYSADEVAGKSGKLEIKFKITKNETCAGTFFDEYALQASFTLDTKKCRNITAVDATLANVGGKKQVSYTMLPGEGIDTSITADVTDFEMAAVSINGIPLSMNIEVDDEELMSQVTDLLDAIAELDDGAGDLKSGVSSLQDAGQNALQSGVNDLMDGAAKLHDGAAGLEEGGEAMQD